MMLNFRSLQRRQQYLIVILTLTVLVGVIVVWFAYFRPVPAITFEENAAAPEEIEIDFSIFDDPIFDELGSPITDIPIPDAESRSNPFIAN